MTTEDSLKVLAILKAAYPNSYKDMTKQEAQGVVTVWAMQFFDLPVDIVLMAVQKCIAASKWPPTIAEVKEKVKALHWEASDALNRSDMVKELGLTPDAKTTERFQRVYALTREYKTMAEPALAQMMFESPLRLGGGTE